MSAGIRLGCTAAKKIVERLFVRWGLDQASSFVVGSFRRGDLTVGDLEILVPPAVSPTNDPIYERVSATVSAPASGLFAGTPPAESGVRCNARKGLKPGFLAADLVVLGRNSVGDDDEFPVQLYRYTRENLGWMLIMRTGPVEFGKYFLAMWKAKWNIPLGDPKHQASVESHLVDAAGTVVPVLSEEEAFRACGIGFVPPERREVVAREIAKSWRARA